MADINIYGKLVNKRGGTLADSNQIAYNGKKVDAALNELYEAVGNSLNEEDVKTLIRDNAVPSFTTREAAMDAINKDTESKIYKLGTPFVIKEGKTDDYDEDYGLYMLIKDSSGNKNLKKVEGGGSATDTGTVTLTVEEFLINGETQDLNQESYECNIGAKLKFSYSFESQYYPDVKGTVYCKVGTMVANQEKLLPSVGSSYTWEYDTSALTAGIYTITIYGAESTGKQTKRTSFKLEIGGLNITSSFNEEKVLTAAEDIQIPLNCSVADTSLALTAHITVDGETFTQSVRAGENTIVIPAIKNPAGTHAISVYITNTKNKTSNTLTFNVISAEPGLIYVLTDKDVYESAAGSRLDVIVRTIQVGQENGKFTAKLVVRDSSGKIFQINGKDENTFTWSYGKNLLQLIGLVHNASDDKFTGYTATLTVKSEDDTATPVEKSFEIHITPNNYNISPITDNLLCWFDAKGKSNSDGDRDTWVDKSGHNVKATFGNFNWSSNGWAKDENGDTALLVNSGAYVELDISPFATEPQEITISVDYKTHDILDSTAKVASCLYEYQGSDTTTYYLRDAWGDYVKNDNNTSESALNTDFKDLAVLESREEAITTILSGITNATEREETRLRLEALDDARLLVEYKNKKFTYVNNILRYFMFAGGYCWINGVTYIADGTTPYDVTYSQSERTINYNKGSENPNYSDKGPDFKKFTGKLSEIVVKQNGFYIDTQYGVLSNSASRTSAEDKFHMNFSENTRTRMDFVISRNPDVEPYYINCIAGYVNGVISGIQEINDSNVFMQSSPDGQKFRVYLGCKGSYDKNGKLNVSDTGEAWIYSFRIYSKALSHSQILYNYAAEIPNEEKKRAVIDNNGLVNPDSLAKLPQICLSGAKINGKSTIRDFIMQLANVDGNAVSDLKSMKEPAFVSYTDPSDTSKNWTNADGTSFNIPCRLQFQGTSSLVYPLKNYKFKMYQYINIDESTGKVEYSKKKLKKEIGSGIAESTFCIKVNYMDSSNVRNTGTANFIADYNTATGNTPPMDLNPKVRTTIYGYPILLYYKEYPTDTKQYFLGVGCLNLDKSDTDSFGLDSSVKDTDGTKFDFGKVFYIDDEFGKDILHKTSLPEGGYETINLKDDTGVYKDYTALRNKDNELVAVVSEKGYLRTVNNDKISNTECFELKANSGASGAGGFGNYSITSVANDLELRYPDDGDVEDEIYSAYKSANKDNPLSYAKFKSPYYYHFQRLIKWVKNADKEEFLKNIDRHFNRNYLMDYYLTIMLCGGVDSLGKNLMVGTWGPENRLYLTDKKVLDKTAVNEQGESIYDPQAFTHTLSNGTEICVTPKKNKITGSYQFAKDENGFELFYDEKCFNRHTGKFESGYSSFVVTTQPGECIWYPMFYDIDTIIGVDNSGQLLYDVDIELGDQLDDGTTVFNTADSYLWRKVRDYLGAPKDVTGSSILSERWSLMERKYFTEENLVEKFYWGQIMSKIPETYYNQDCFIKYIYEGPEAKVGSKSYLYCCHGNSYEHIKRWIAQRIKYLDTMFGLVGTTNASLRFNYANYDGAYDDSDDYYANFAKLAADHPEVYEYTVDKDGVGHLTSKETGLEIKPIEFNFKTYQPVYVGIKWYNNGKIHYQRVKRNKTGVISGNVKTSGDAEVFVYGGETIKEIGDMSPYNVKQVDFRNLTKLNKLQLGSEEKSCVINKLDLGVNTYLSDLILTNCGSLATVDVSGCINLKRVDMTDSGITSIRLPSVGGALESIAYSNAITSIDLQNFMNLTNVSAPVLNNLTRFVIKNCPKILGSKENPNAKAWGLMQQTYNTSSLTDIQVTSYGAVEPKKVGDGEYFFLDKYCDYGTSKNIKGEIYYTGTVVPKNYIKFATAYPYLTVTYDNIEDASEMFANYNNLNAISKISVYTGTDIYGNDSYKEVFYWVDDTPELQEKWHNQTMYNKYGTQSTYTSDKLYYNKDGQFYRLLGIYDKSDLDMIRAEIKEHLSSFKRFTNLTGLFRNMAILDYIDPDTFNSIDISTADTTEMFAGCTGLRYFETPNDTVKNNKKILYYNLDSDGEKVYVDKSEWEGVEGTSEVVEGVYINPFTKEETSELTSTYRKGMRNIGSGMFRGCQQAKIFIRSYENEKITVDCSAFTYSIYDVTSNPSNYTFMRPVILFDLPASTLLRTTTNPTYVGGDGKTYNNIPVEDSSDLYFDMSDNDGFKKFNYQNSYITLNDTNWLREVYFDIKSVTLDDSDIAANFTLSYATRSDGKRILFSAEGTGTTFNVSENSYGTDYTNDLKLYSVCTGAFADLKNTSTIQIPLPKVECLDVMRPLFNEESSILSILTNMKYSFDDTKNKFSDKLKNIYIVDTVSIPSSSFSNVVGIEQVGLSYVTKRIEDRAFNSCTDLKRIVYRDKSDTPFKNSAIEYIGDSAFANCDSLATIKIPQSVKHLGIDCFNTCASLNTVEYGSSLTTIPSGCFAGCTNLATFIGLSKDLTEFGDSCFTECSKLKVINESRAEGSTDENPIYNNGLGLISGEESKNFDALTKLERIGDNAFHNVKDIPYPANRMSLLKLPKSIKYIGKDAFSITGGDNPQNNFMELVWDGDPDTDFTELVIMEKAFYGIPIAWRTSPETAPIPKCTFIPQLMSIGNSAFKLPKSDDEFEYALAKNSKEEIGSDWVENTKKIIYDYYGLFTDTGSDEKYLYLLSSDNSKDTRYAGRAYIQKANAIRSAVSIPEYTTYNGQNFKVVEILAGAFDDLKELNTIFFDENSQLELIETNVLKSTALSSIMVGQTQDIIPPTLTIETGNMLHNTQWFSLQTSDASKKGKFIVLGKNIIGYVPNDDFNGIIDLTDSSIENCDTVFDSAFEGMKTVTTVKFSDRIKNIYSNSFSGTSLTTVDLPKYVERIDNKAFFGCHFETLVLPASIKKMGANAFAEYDDRTKRGVLRSVDIKDGADFTGDPFTVQQEMTTNAGNTNLPQDVNVSLRELHVPKGMARLVSASYSENRNFSQVRNLYLGTLKINDTPGDEHNGTWLYPNVPLYRTNAGEDAAVTYTNTGIPYTNSKGDQMYSYRFFYDMAVNTKGFKDSYLETTEKYSVCPVGDFVGDSMIYLIRRYDNGTMKDGTTASDIEDLSRVDILRIIAGYSSADDAPISKINIRDTDYKKLTGTDMGIIGQCGKKISFAIVKI